MLPQKNPYGFGRRLPLEKEFQCRHIVSGNVSPFIMETVVIDKKPIVIP
jgi:hypothetical protein